MFENVFYLNIFNHYKKITIFFLLFYSMFKITKSYFGDTDIFEIQIEKNCIVNLKRSFDNSKLSYVVEVNNNNKGLIPNNYLTKIKDNILISKHSYLGNSDNDEIDININDKYVILYTYSDNKWIKIHNITTNEIGIIPYLI